MQGGLSGKVVGLILPAVYNVQKLAHVKAADPATPRGRP